MNFDLLTVNQKLYGSYGLIFLLALVMGGTAMYSLHDLGESTHLLGEQQAGKLYAASQLEANAARMGAMERGILLRAMSGDTVRAEQNIVKYGENETESRKQIEVLRSLGLTAKAAEMVNEMQAGLDASDGPYEKFVAAIRANDIKAATAINIDELLPPLDRVGVAGTALKVRVRGQMAEANDQSQGLIGHTLWLMGALMLVGCLIGAVVVWIIRNLDASLRRTVLELNEGSGQVASAAGQVSTSSQTLARESSEQAAMIEETSASAEEINAMASRNVQNSQSAQQLGEEALVSTEQANSAVAECVHAMDAIGDSSNKIAKTLQVIDKIAFQTNILALNAAVEAARAGEAGMGFAVVAEEVRSLAQRCAEAAQETSALVELSLNNSNEGRQKIDVMVESGRKVNDVFARMKTLVDAIKEGSQEQGKGIDQIGRAIRKMEQGIQQNAANAEESAAAAEELNAQSDVLRNAARVLARMVGLASEGTSGVMTRFAGAVKGAKPVARHAAGPRPSGAVKKVSARVAKLQPKMVAVAKAAAPKVLAKAAKPAPVMAGASEFPMDDDFRAF